MRQGSERKEEAASVAIILEWSENSVDALFKLMGLILKAVWETIENSYVMLSWIHKQHQWTTEQILIPLVEIGSCKELCERMIFCWIIHLVIGLTKKWFRMMKKIWEEVAKLKYIPLLNAWSCEGLKR